MDLSFLTCRKKSFEMKNKQLLRGYCEEDKILHNQEPKSVEISQFLSTQ